MRLKTEIFKTPLPYLALFIAHFIWGANFVISKIALQEFPVMSLAFLRFFLATLLLLPFFITLESKERKIKLADWPKMVIISILMVGFNIALFYQGLVKTTAIDAATISLSVPLISVIAGWWFLKEKIYAINLFGIILGFVGAITIIGVPLLLFGEIDLKSSLFGNLLILSSSICFVTGAIIAKDLISKYHPLVITTLLFAISAVIFVIPALIDLLQNPNWISNISIFGIFGLSYVTLMSSIAAYFLMITGLEKVEISKANLFQYLEPAIAATLAVPLLYERISYSFIVGTCLVVLGVYWATLGRQQHHHSEHRAHSS